MSNSEIEILKRALEREKLARKASEKILEEKSRELYFLSKKLQDTNLQLEKLLKEKSTELKGVFENINDAFVVITLEGDVLKMNEIAKEIFEYDLSIENFNVNDLLLFEDIDNSHQSFNQLIEKGSYTNFVTKIKTKNEAIKWVQINASAIYNDENIPIAAQGIIRDITNEIKSNELLRESENRLTSLILNLDSGILLEDEEGKIIVTNTKFCEIFNINAKPEELIGQLCAEQLQHAFTLFQNPQKEIHDIQQLLAIKQQKSGDEILFNNGKVLERDYIPIFVDGNFKGNLWAYKDVTLRRKFRKSLEIEKEKYSSIIANMNLGLVEVDTNDQIMMVNHSFCEMSGYTKEELIGKIAGKILPIENEQNIITSQNQKRLIGESNSYELNVKNKKGEDRIWLISGAPNYNIQGEVIGSIGIHLDITEIKLLQNQKQQILEQLERSNKDLQDYAHIVSHDLKSPLRSIYALVDWIKADNQDKFDEHTLQNFTLIEETLETMETLIANVLEYSSVGFKDQNQTNVDLNVLLSSLSKTVYIPTHIQLIVENKLPIVKGTVTKYQQLFQNLISNSVKFIDKEKGFITIKAIDEGDNYLFAFSDNGIGIEEKNHKKVFEIFQSLKKSKDSSGIGLTIVKKIIELYGGDIWIDSQPNVGTTFFFTIKK